MRRDGRVSVAGARDGDEICRFYASLHLTHILGSKCMRKKMNLNTFKTAIGFLGTLIERHSSLKFRQDSPESVFNYLMLSDSLATSGQPTRAQFENIKRGGFQTIINLLPHDHENALPGQKALMSDLGLEYIYIPVDFKNPQEAEYDAFCVAMVATEARKVWVHCAANMRVSAFVYRYRVEKLTEDEPSARRDLEKIWTPFGVWRDFVAPSSSISESLSL